MSLQKNVKRGATLIGTVNAKLTSVETEVIDAFKALEVGEGRPQFGGSCRVRSSRPRFVY
jgi:hypothetical protein